MLSVFRAMTVTFRVIISPQYCIVLLPIATAALSLTALFSTRTLHLPYGKSQSLISATMVFATLNDFYCSDLHVRFSVKIKFYDLLSQTSRAVDGSPTEANQHSS